MNAMPIALDMAGEKPDNGFLKRIPLRATGESIVEAHIDLEKRMDFRSGRAFPMNYYF